MNAFVLAGNDSFNITHSTHHQVQISIKRNETSQAVAKQFMKTSHPNHSVSVLTVSLLNMNTENLIHRHLLRTRLLNKTSWFSDNTSAQKKKTSTIPLIQIFVLYIQLTPDNVICPRNVELDIVDSLHFVLNKYIQDTKTNAHCN